MKNSFALFINTHTLATPRLATLNVCFLILSFSAIAQEERGLTRDGNKLFDKGKYADAEASYKKALEKKNNFPEAIFNLGDAIYQQGRHEEAAKQFELAAKMLRDTKQKALAYHNLGNSHLSKQEYEAAVKDYKNALRINPADKDTKYNLAYANEKLKDKQNNKDNKQNQDKKNQDQDKKGDKDKKDNKDSKGEPKDDKKNRGKDPNEDKGDGKDKQPKKGNKQELSKEQAEKLLEALKAEEQKAQEKMQKKGQKPQDVKVEKDW